MHDTTTACPADCACHTSAYTPCSAPGGCGTHGCTPTPTGGCTACHKRDPEYGHVCDPCRRWLPLALASIPDLARRLADELLPTDDSHSSDVLICRTCGHTVPATTDRRHARHPGHPEYDHSPTGQWHGGWRQATLIRHAGGPAPTLPTDSIITKGGTTEAATPLNLHIHDLLADVIRDGGRPIDTTGDNWIPASRLTPVTIDHTWFEVIERREETDNDDGTTTVTFHRDFRHRADQLTVMDRRQRHDANGHKMMTPAGDQIGAVPVAHILDQEMRAWQDAGAPGSRWRPTPTIPNLTAWLTARLDWACDHYPAMDAFTETLNQLRGQMMAALGDFDPEAEPCDGVDCDRCHLRMLYRRQDGTGDIECHNPDCRRVFTPTEYREHLRELAPQARRKRPTAA